MDHSPGSWGRSTAVGCVLRQQPVIWPHSCYFWAHGSIEDSVSGKEPPYRSLKTLTAHPCLTYEQRHSQYIEDHPQSKWFIWRRTRGSYAIKVGVFYAITAGLCTTFSVKVPLFQGIFTPYGSSFYGICWGHFFANMGGGGCRKRIQNDDSDKAKTDIRHF